MHLHARGFQRHEEKWPKGRLVFRASDELFLLFLLFSVFSLCVGRHMLLTLPIYSHSSLHEFGSFRICVAGD